MSTGPHQKNVMQDTWCYAHILKLAINDVTQVEPFFGLLEKKQLSFSQSYTNAFLFGLNRPALKVMAMKSSLDSRKKIGKTKVLEEAKSTV